MLKIRRAGALLGRVHRPLDGAPGRPRHRADRHAASGRHYPVTPTGTLDGFLNTQLKPYVDTTSDPWKSRSGITLAAADLSQFQRASAIRAAFFPSGTTALAPGLLGGFRCPAVP